MEAPYEFEVKDGEWTLEQLEAHISQARGQSLKSVVELRTKIEGGTLFIFMSGPRHMEIVRRGGRWKVASSKFQDFYPDTMTIALVKRILVTAVANWMSLYEMQSFECLA